MSIKIFLIEDDELTSLLLVKLINNSFNNVVTSVFKSVETAFERINHKPDFIILDHFLEGANGIDSIPQFKKLLPHSKIAVASSQHNVVNFRNAYSFGADEYFIKNVLLGENIISFIKLNMN